MTASDPKIIARPNWFTLVAIMLFILVLCGLLVTFIANAIHKWRQNLVLTEDDHFTLYFGVPGVGVVLLLFIQYLFRPWGVYKLGSGSYELRSMLGRSLNLSVSNLFGFSACSAPSRWKDWQGVVLYLKDGRHVELNDFSLKPLQAMVDDLNALNVPLLGTERSWYPLLKFRYKFDPK